MAGFARVGGAALLLQALIAGPLAAQFEFNRKPFDYQNAESTDAVARLAAALDDGAGGGPRWDPRQGWLPEVLDRLDTPADSQTLVFSKTSLQRRKISPERPRALYFNDDVYVGYVPFGDVLELSAVDPRLGAVFYTVDQKNRDELVITRDRSQCMSCHATRRTKSVPGYLVRSVFPTTTGEPELRLGDTVTDHTTRLSDRFGGWYVTGWHGDIRHRGNAFVDAPAETAPDARSLDREAGANRNTLDKLVSTRRYPEPGSDIVALMVLEHQTQMHNLITHLAYATRQTVYYADALNKIDHRPAGTLSAGNRRRIERATDELVAYLLFSGEAALGSPIEGSSSFTQTFAARGPRDSRGRSLRDFDLSTRLFRYPCSFLIYSEAIDALPAPALDCLRRRLTAVLTGEDQSGGFAHLSAEDRRAILEILRETKPEILAADNRGVDQPRQ